MYFEDEIKHRMNIYDVHFRMVLLVDLLRNAFFFKRIEELEITVVSSSNLDYIFDYIQKNTYIRMIYKTTIALL
jgi:hypothetical protein